MTVASLSNSGTQQSVRVPPQSREAEICVLGAMILDPSSIDIVVQWLQSDHFYTPAHSQIYEVLVAMIAAGKPVDLVTVRDELTQRKILDAVGGAEYLVSLIDGVPNAANIEYYGRIVRDKALLRGLISLTTELCREAYDSTEDAPVIIDRAEHRVFELAAAQVSEAATPIRTIIQQTFEQLQSLDGSITGLQTGYFKLDDLTCGFQPGEMIIIAARPSIGKTAIALNMAEHMAVDCNKPVLIFSLEMARQQLAQRFLASRARFDQTKLRRGSISPEDWTHLQMAAGELEQSPIFIDDSAELTMIQLRAKARRMKARHDIQCIFIDYIQLITPMRGESRQVQVSDMSRNIKALARQLNIPVITLAQLNRAVEERIGHRPRLSDLRESGAIEQDADVVCLLHRPSLYDEDAEPNVAEFIVAKQRNGPTDTVKLTFLRESTRFENYHAEDGIPV
ncbi:MAG: replicative DNA helicase [Planctomycetes bacterium]|nr:replicative DNA helicase [Planctomycetota bacterium]